MLTDNLILDRGGEKLFSVTKLWGEPNKYKSYITHTVTLHDIWHYFCHFIWHRSVIF